MRFVEPGFLRPAQRSPNSESSEKLIAESCPGAVIEPWPRVGWVDPYWGPSLTVHTGFATDDAVRYRASSGGVVTALALHALKSKLVDRVVHVAPDPIHPTRNVIVVSSAAKDIVNGAGSRYAASDPLSQIDRILAEGGTIAFIGKPCDVAALRALAKMDARVGRHIKLMLSFFCAGIPSARAASRVVKALGAPEADVSAFRYRGNGWPGFAVASINDGRDLKMSYSDSWGNYLSKEVQFRCKICTDGVGAHADIACADAWFGDDNGYPDFEEKDGRSLVVTRSATGAALLKSALEAAAISVEPVDFSAIERMQPSQARRKRLLLSRLIALRLILRAVPRYAGTEVFSASRRAGIVENAKSFLGMLRRVVFKNSSAF